MQAQHHINLQPFNTFGFSVTAERLVSVSSKEKLSEYYESGEPTPSLILGGGSNLLITRNIPGTVLKIELPGIELISEDEDHVYVKAGAGVVWHQFVLHALAHNWAGAENLSLIPGNCGAAPMQNIGAYGIEIKEIFHSLEAYIVDDKCWQTFSLADCNFGYRESLFKRALKNKAVIASVTFKLNKKPNFNTTYGAINAELEAMGVHDLSIQAVSQAVINIRQSKLPDPKKIGNSGSFFKNPVVSMDQFTELQKRYPGIVGYASGDQMKLAAGWLIEQSGFKGKRFGNYGVHDKQALVLVNYGGATGKEIYELSEEIIRTINATFNVLLEREVNVI